MSRSRGLATVDIAFDLRCHHLQRDTDGRYTERSLKTYLVLATVFETCEFNNVNELKFLLSKETTLDGLLRMGGRRIMPLVELIPAISLRDHPDLQLFESCASMPDRSCVCPHVSRALSLPK